MPKKKKHPILSVLVILGVIILVMGSFMMFLIKMFSTPSAFSLGSKIAVIPIQGTIVNSHPIISELVRFKKDGSIKAIILRIDSPGGGVGATQEIYQEVRKTIQTKKVVVSMGGVAASGGYYIASAANKIVANPGTITGSIGVLIEFIRLEDLMTKIGIDFEIIKSGEFKDIGSPHRKLTDRDMEIINDLITDIQNQFVKDVAVGRNLTIKQVRDIADGRVFSGAKAKKLGLVDALGNFQDSVDLTKEMAGIKGEPNLIYARKSKPSLWELIFESAIHAFENQIQDAYAPLEYRWGGISRP
jgi:protease-4